MRIMISPTSPSSCPLLIGLSTASYHVSKRGFVTIPPHQEISLPEHASHLSYLLPSLEHTNTSPSTTAPQHHTSTTYYTTSAPKTYSRSRRFTFTKHWSDSPRQTTLPMLDCTHPPTASPSSRHRDPLQSSYSETLMPLCGGTASSKSALKTITQPMLFAANNLPPYFRIPVNKETIKIHSRFSEDQMMTSQSK